MYVMLERENNFGLLSLSSLMLLFIVLYFSLFVYYFIGVNKKMEIGGEEKGIKG